MGILDDLLTIDADNAARWQENLGKFDHALPPLMNSAAEMYHTFAHCMTGVFDESTARDVDCIRRRAVQLGLSEEEMKQRLSSDRYDPVQDSDARGAHLQLQSRMARVIIFMLLRRQYDWGATDLLRMRLTPADGYRRLQAESIGLLLTIQAEPAVGDRWLRIRTLGEGQRFFRGKQARIKEAIRAADLEFIYDHGSAVAQHVRLQSAVLGLSFGDAQAALAYQEVREDDPFSYFLSVVSYLSTQVKIFHVLAKAFPEMQDPIWPGRVQRFGQDVGRLWKTLEEKFPEQRQEIVEWERRRDRGPS